VLVSGVGLPLPATEDGAGSAVSPVRRNRPPHLAPALRDLGV